jgi:hypothetical protein
MKLSPKRKAALADIPTTTPVFVGKIRGASSKVMLATILSEQFESEYKREQENSRDPFAGSQVMPTRALKCEGR